MLQTFKKSIFPTMDYRAYGYSIFMNTTLFEHEKRVGCCPRLMLQKRQLLTMMITTPTIQRSGPARPVDGEHAYLSLPGLHCSHSSWGRVL